ncbi:hypothetical protein [Prosthecobacter sp.]|uniref:hypothetical protein n=1 Tax=Prosthecobacter sp. TaxID=1965333 RepID=UPI0037849F1B
MNLPADIPAPPPPSSTAIPDGNLIDTPPPVTAKQRAEDFNKRFFWHGQELRYSVASEFYYRELRTHMNAPSLHTYRNVGDFTPEGSRVLYCSSLTPKDISALQLLPHEKQIERYHAWVGKNIAFHELIEASELGVEINNAITRAMTKPLETEEDEIDGMGN